MHVALAVDDVLPGRRARVLEVGHEDLRARVERVDHHLAVDRSRDLDAAVDEIRRRRRDAEVLRRAGELTRPALAPPGEQPLALGVQLAVEALDERERLPRQHV